MAERAQRAALSAPARTVAAHGPQLLLLTTAATAAAYARTTLGPLQETMRIALSLSDYHLALLQGPALALPLAAAAIPLGFAIDRSSRIHLILIATMLNLGAGLATALAPNFTVLFAARCAAGLATPAIFVAAYSLLSDWYPPAQRGRATTVVVVGQTAGASAAFALGGELLAMTAGPDGWRWAALWMAAILVPVVFATLALREPARTGAAIDRPAARELWPELWRYRGVIATLLAGMAVVNLADGAVLVWAAPALARGFDLQPDRVGAIMAMALLAGGVLGPVAGGVLADLCQRSGGPRRTVLALGALVFLSVPTCFFSLMPETVSASIALGLFLTMGTAISVTTTAVAIIAIPNELRGLSVSLKTATAVLFGLGLAPLTVSLLSEVMGGPAKVGESLSILCATTSLLGAVAFVFGRRHFS
jgi:MFS family permease